MNRTHIARADVIGAALFAQQDAGGTVPGTLGLHLYTDGEVR